jgi:predicted CoA-binding protein
MSDLQCEIPEYNPPSEEIKAILDKYKTVAIVGLSPKPERDSHKVARYLKENHYRIVPVNPGQKEILGEKCYPNLKAIPFPIDVVDIFRRPEAIPPVVDDAIEIAAKVVWMQLGLAHNQAAAKSRKAGLEVVMNKCIKIEHMRLPSLSARVLTL